MPCVAWLLIGWELGGWYSGWVPSRSTHALPWRHGTAKPDDMIRILLPANRTAWPRLVGREKMVHFHVIANPLTLPDFARRPQRSG
jgi:hypothetical protein